MFPKLHFILLQEQFLFNPAIASSFAPPSFVSTAQQCSDSGSEIQSLPSHIYLGLSVPHFSKPFNTDRTRPDHEGYLGDILGISGGHLGHTLGMYWTYLGHVLGISDAVTSSSNTRSYTLWSVPSSPGRSFLHP